MKKTLRVLMGMIIGIAMLTAPAPLFAAGGGPEFEFTASASSAKADGSSKITFNIFSYYYTCVTGYATSSTTCSDGSTPQKTAGGANLEYSVQVSGSGNSIGGTYTGPNGAPSFKINGEGKASFTLASTVAESKTVKFYFTELNDPNHAKNPATTVTFTTPPAPTPPKKTAPAPAPTPVEVAPPAALSTSSLVVGDQPVSDASNIVVTEEKPLVLSGKTVANGVVKLFIFSEPKEASVTADAEGNWTYTVAGLEPGAHHIEAEVTDPATSKTSARATLVAFEVAEPIAKTQVATPEKKSNKIWWFIVGGAAFLTAAGLAVWWFWLRKKLASPTLPTPAPNSSVQPENNFPEQSDQNPTDTPSDQPHRN